MAKYKAHINTEVCNAVSAIKYIFKYVFKGSDAVTVVIKSKRVDGDHDDDLNEVDQYLDGRYISSPEAINRFLGFPTNCTSPAVILRHSADCLRGFFSGTPSASDGGKNKVPGKLIICVGRAIGMRRVVSKPSLQGCLLSVAERVRISRIKINQILSGRWTVRRMTAGLVQLVGNPKNRLMASGLEMYLPSRYWSTSFKSSS